MKPIYSFNDEFGVLNGGGIPDSWSCGQRVATCAGIKFSSMLIEFGSIVPLNPRLGYMRTSVLGFAPSRDED